MLQVIYFHNGGFNCTPLYLFSCVTDHLGQAQPFPGIFGHFFCSGFFF